MKPYEIIVDQILDKIESWTLPWQKPWIWWTPCNYETQTEYRWINKLLLLFDDFKDKRYLTPKQIFKLWGVIKKWEKATKVIFWKYPNEDNEGSEDIIKKKSSYPIIKYYNIFNIEQIEWIELKPKKKLDIEERYNKAQTLLEKYKDKPTIIEWPNACYKTMLDVIEIPNLHKFKTVDEYYSTLFHELIHSTWSKNRLNRFWDNVLNYWNNEYSFEELVAEIWAMFLCQEVWIIQKTRDNSIAYIKWWLEYLSKNKKDIIYASSLSQIAFDYIKNNSSII